MHLRHYNEKQKEKIIETIKRELSRLPEYEINAINEQSRINIDDYLWEVFFDDKKNFNFTLEEMRKLDLTNIDSSSVWNVDFSGIDLSYTNIDGKFIIDRGIKKVAKHETNYAFNIHNYLYLKGTNFEGVDLSGITLEAVDIRYANLKGTGANINVQRCYSIDAENYKSLEGANLEGLDLSRQSFEKVDIRGTNLKNTGAIIDFSKILDWDDKTILEGCTVLLSGLSVCNIPPTALFLKGAHIVNDIVDIENEIVLAFQEDKHKNLEETLDSKKGLKYSDLNRTQKKEIVKLIKEYLATLPPYEIDAINRQPRLKIDELLNEVLFNGNTINFTLDELRKLDLSNLEMDLEIDFYGRDFSYTNIDGNFILKHSVFVNKVYENKDIEFIDLSAANFEGVDLSDIVINNNVCLEGTNLKNTGIKINPQCCYSYNYGKLSLIEANLEGLDLSDACFDDVNISGTNLRNTGAIIDFSKISGWNDNTILEGCTVLLSGLLESRIYDGSAMLKGAKILDDISEIREETSSIILSSIKGPTLGTKR